MNNSQVAHAFFYQNETGKTKGKSLSCDFENNKFWSYSTVIAEITTGLKGQDVLIISYNNHSNTTSKHIGKVRSACPFGYENIVQLPTTRGSNCIDIEYKVNKWIEYLKNFDEKLFTRQENRIEYSNIYNQLIKINKVLYKFKMPKKIINTYNLLNDNIKIKELKEKQKQLKEYFKDFMSKNTFSEACNFAWSYGYNNKAEKDLKTKLKKYLQHQKDISLIWFDDDIVKTSQNIRVDRKEVETCLKLWKNEKLKHGQKIGMYTVMEVNKNYIKVGCHKITSQNLNLLCDEIKEKALV